MKRFTKIRTNSSLAAFVVLLALLAAVLTGCADKDLLYPQAQSPSQEMHGVQIGLQVSVPVFGTTRTPSGSYDDARLTDYENFLDINLNAEKKNFRIYFFTLDNQFITEFVPTEFVEDDTQAISPNAKLYTLRGNLTSSLGPDFKIVLLANWGVDNYPTLVWQKDGNGNTTQRSTMADLSQTAAALAHTFTGPLSLGAGEGKQYIPMFGIKTCTGKSFVNEMLTWCDKIHLLRAVAKIEVIEAEESLEYISQVQLANYNAKGICAPKGVYEESQYIKSEYATDYVGYTTLLNDCNDETPGTVDLIQTAEGSKKWIIYVPEYQNLTDDTDPTSIRSDASKLMITMKRKVDDVETGTYDVNFKYYTYSIATSNGAHVDDHFNIQRNYDYRFTVTRGTEFEIVAEVLPYTSVVLNPLFGMLRDSEGRIVDIHGRLIDYQGNLIQENEDGKLYDPTLTPFESYLGYIGQFIDDHHNIVDEFGRLISNDEYDSEGNQIWEKGWLIAEVEYVDSEDGQTKKKWSYVDAYGTPANLVNGYLQNAMGLIDNYGNAITLQNEGTIPYRVVIDGTNIRCDKWGHLVDDATGTYLVNAEGHKVDIYMRPIVDVTLSNGVTQQYLVNSDGEFIDSNGARITVDTATGYMYNANNRRVDKNGRTIDSDASGNTYYVKYIATDETETTFIKKKVNKYGEFIDDLGRRINEDGQLIDMNGNILE